MKRVGFIGVGVMGKSMVRNLMKAGFEVAVYTRTKSKIEDVLSEGAVWCPTVGACAAGRDAVITIVGYPKDVEQVYFGEGGILDRADKGTVLIDMTTTSPAQAEAVDREARARGLYFLDAPVSGGDTGAKNGTLSIMVGGDGAVFDRCRELFQAMGSNIVHEGKAGCGQHTKMANQIALSGTIASLCEAIAYSKQAGLDPQKVLDTIGKGAAASWQMDNNGPKILQGDDAPGFFIKHFVKDMGIAVESAKEMGLQLDVLEQVLELYRWMEGEGMGDLGTQALIRRYG